MKTVIIEGEVRIPAWVDSLEAFRRWADSDDFPDEGRVDYLQGEIWVDMSKEQIFSHVAVKGEFCFVLVGLVKAGKLGRFLPDGVLLSSAEADFSSQPDGVFLSNESLRSGRVRLLEGSRGGYVEIVGAPDMLLEVVSDKSVQKDTVRLRNLYWEAEVTEYWLVDARRNKLDLTILRRAARGYAAQRKQDGWVKSGVFNRSFKLTQELDEHGHPEYDLQHR
jgi:Uma2 family endonuclease